MSESDIEKDADEDNDDEDDGDDGVDDIDSGMRSKKECTMQTTQTDQEGTGNAIYFLFATEYNIPREDKR